jgi:hypothetical protein
MKPVETVWHTSDVRALLSALDRKDEVLIEMQCSASNLAKTIEDWAKSSLPIPAYVLRAREMTIESIGRVNEHFDGPDTLAKGEIGS